MRALAQGTSLNQVVAAAIASDLPGRAEYVQTEDGDRLRIAEEAYATNATGVRSAAKASKRSLTRKPSAR